MKAIIILLFTNCAYVVFANAQDSVLLDTVYLFTTEEAYLENRGNDDRQLGPKHLQITNYAGNTLILRLSSDQEGRNAADMLIHSPEKKVFLCPPEVDQIYITVNPNLAEPAHSVLDRNGKYELYYNTSKRLYDILKVKD